jgi:D-3-phosphoglycerate dehydrogenase
MDAVKDADGVLLNLHTLKKDEIAAMTKCKVISRYGIGYDNVDVDAATAKGIWVARVPAYGADESVSDQAMALMLDCIRRTTFKHNRILGGEWNLMRDYKIHSVRSSVIGIIGLGTIGKVMARKLSGFEPKEILAYDPHKSAEGIAKYGVRKVEFDELLKLADCITIHCPLNDETRHMIDEPQFALMKESAILINTARGGIVSEKALADVLAKHRIAAAGVDVFEADPLPADSPLRKVDNLVISDHIGYYSEESLNTLKSLTAQNVANVLMGKPPLFPLNEIK